MLLNNSILRGTAFSDAIWIRKGLWGLWDRLAGKRKRTLLENEKEVTEYQVCDQLEKDVLAVENKEAILQHRRKIETAQITHREAIKELNKDIAWLRAPPELSNTRDHANEKGDSRKKRKNRIRDGPQQGR